MTTWEDVVCKAKELAEAAGRKATDVAGLAKSKLKIAENEHAIEVTMEALGRLLYESHRNGAELPEETVEELLKQVDELNAENARLQAEIDNSRGKKTCAACGGTNPEDAAYCNKCGKEL